jgi:hypothetical protein
MSYRILVDCPGFSTPPERWQVDRLAWPTMAKIMAIRTLRGHAAAAELWRERRAA